MTDHKLVVGDLVKPTQGWLDIFGGIRLPSKIASFPMGPNGYIRLENGSEWNPCNLELVTEGPKAPKYDLKVGDLVRPTRECINRIPYNSKYDYCQIITGLDGTSGFSTKGAGNLELHWLKEDLEPAYFEGDILVYSKSYRENRTVGNEKSPKYTFIKPDKGFQSEVTSFLIVKNPETKEEDIYHWHNLELEKRANKSETKPEAKESNSIKEGDLVRVKTKARACNLKNICTHNFAHFSPKHGSTYKVFQVWKDGIKVKQGNTLLSLPIEWLELVTKEVTNDESDKSTNPTGQLKLFD